MPISVFLKANVQILWFYQKALKANLSLIPSRVASLLTSGLDQGGKTTVVGLHSTTHHGNAPTRTRGPVEVPLSLSQSGASVRVCRCVA